MSQVNSPYPATPYLTGFLKKRGYAVVQEDPSLELLLRLLSPEGLEKLAKKMQFVASPSPSVRNFLKQEGRYREVIGPVIRFLQNQDPTLAYRLADDSYVPRGPRFSVVRDLEANELEGLDSAFGVLGTQDRAKYLASLCLDDIADAIRDGVDSRFELARYGEKLALSASRFDPILQALEGPPTLVDEMLDQLTNELMAKHQPEVVGISVPFPGNVYGAFRMARQIKKKSPAVKIILGGGYVNTELRELSDLRVFQYVDYLTFDDGQVPLMRILENLKNSSNPKWLRTMRLNEGKIVYQSDAEIKDLSFSEMPTPTYEGLPLRQYLSMSEFLNPMHRIWSDGRWNKLILAHGCYWKKCSFCDISLDYIARYEADSAERIVEHIEYLISETGQTGFHFVDEAAPPSLLKAVAERLLERKITISWWGNIRFEKTFTTELTNLLKRSGCIAVTGGLEVASDRLLKLMEKGVTVEQVAQVTKAFTDSGILVHAYLMYGFPTETLQETVDSLERVRQLFLEGCLQSAFWHRFACTVHSPVGKNPEKYGITLHPVESAFAKNDIPFKDPTDTDHDWMGVGLRKAVYNYMLGIGLEEDVRWWFGEGAPKAKVPKTFIRKALGLETIKTKPLRGSPSPYLQ